MIDLKKEREAFESMNPSEMLKAIEYKVDSDSYQPKEPILSLSVLQNAVELNYGWLRWKKRAELAQAEINELKQKLAESEVNKNMWRDEKNHAIKRWNDISRDYNELKQKLARYENPDYVLVPKEPSEKLMQALEKGFSWGDDGDGEYNPIIGYKAMIEAVEKYDVPKNS